MRTRLLVGFTLLLTSSMVSAAEPIKVGIIGLDSYHSVAFTQLYHSPKATGDLTGLRVVAHGQHVQRFIGHHIGHRSVIQRRSCF